MNRPVRILIVDDEPLFGTTTQQFLQGRGYEVQYVGSGQEGEVVLRSGGIDLVIADLDMPGNRKLEFLKTCRTEFQDIPFLVVTGRPSLPSAIEGIRLGIHDYFLKPIDLDDLLHSIERASPRESRAQRADASRNQELSGNDSFSEIIGTSLAVLTLKHLAGRVSKSNATVLIRGESGTGKELLARGIHANSMRRNGPFVTVDCASIPENLIESTLFGHVRGAFTGAVESRVGLVGAADGGSLFLDEIGELPLPMQAKLLRTLQFGTFTPVGSTQEQKVDVRILAATHRDLAREAQEGGFRTDLYYRLSVLELVSPPLRDRHGDITHLAKIFVERIAARDEIPAPMLTTEALEVLNAYRWPGNLRELQNVMERVVCLTTSSEIGVDVVGQAIEQRVVLPGGGSAGSVENGGSIGHTPQLGEGVVGSSVTAAGASAAASYTHQDFLSNNERLYIEELLRRHRGNVSRAAKEAKMSRQGLHKALLRLGISASNYRAN